MDTRNTHKAIMKAINAAGRALLLAFSIIFALVAICALVSVFTDSVGMGLFGTASASFLAINCFAAREALR